MWRRHTSIMDLTYRLACYQCERTFKHKKTLVRHQRSSHQDQRALCIVCGRTFHRHDSLTRHLAEQHGNETGTVECDVCGAWVRPRYLKEHRRSRVCRMSRAPPASAHALVSRSVQDIDMVQLAPIVEPLLITVNLWLDILRLTSNIRGSDQSRVLYTRGLAIQTVRMSFGHIRADVGSRTYCAVAMLAACEFRLLGFDAAMAHCRALEGGGVFSIYLRDDEDDPFGYALRCLFGEITKAAQSMKPSMQIAPGRSIPSIDFGLQSTANALSDTNRYLMPRSSRAFDLINYIVEFTGSTFGNGTSPTPYEPHSNHVPPQGECAGCDLAEELEFNRERGTSDIWTKYMWPHSLARLHKHRPPLFCPNLGKTCSRRVKSGGRRLLGQETPLPTAY